MMIASKTLPSSPLHRPMDETTNKVINAPSTPPLQTATIETRATLSKKSKLSSVLSPSSLLFSSLSQQLPFQTQIPQYQQQSLPTRSSFSSSSSSSTTSPTNVFTNFSPSCCCRQMITPPTSAAVSVIKTAKNATSITNDGFSKKKSLKNENSNGGCGADSGLNGDNSAEGSSFSSSSSSSSKTFRQFLPIGLCILSFATVLSILIVYMDTTEIRHQQFKLNMSRDYELYGVPQDDPTLIAFLREIHMKKYPMNFLKNAPVEHFNFTERHELTPEMANYISNLVGGKLNGGFIQSLTGSTSMALTAPWLAETLNWSGLIIEPEPRRYFSLRKQNAHRPKVQVVHACLSPSGYPKEVRIHEDSDVRINSLLDEETSWFNSRVKCFPLYTLMLAINKVDYDLLSLGCPGQELQILQTLPFNKVNIEVISIHLTENRENVTEYIRNITKFLLGKSYKLQKRFENNYIYQRINSNKTRKQFRTLSKSSSSSSSSSLSSPITITTSTTTHATPQVAMTTTIANTHQ